MSLSALTEGFFPNTLTEDWDAAGDKTSITINFLLFSSCSAALQQLFCLQRSKRFILPPPQASIEERDLVQSSLGTPKRKTVFWTAHRKACRGHPGSPQHRPQNTPAGTGSCYREPPSFTQHLVFTHIHLIKLWLLAENNKFSHAWPGHRQYHPQPSTPN